MVCFWFGTLHSQKNLCPVSPIESTSTHGLSYNLGLSSSSGMKVVKQFSAKPPFGCLSKLKENHIIYKFVICFSNYNSSRNSRTSLMFSAFWVTLEFNFLPRYYINTKTKLLWSEESAGLGFLIRTINFGLYIIHQYFLYWKQFYQLPAQCSSIVGSFPFELYTNSPSFSLSFNPSHNWSVGLFENSSANL